MIKKVVKKFGFPQSGSFVNEEVLFSIEEELFSSCCSFSDLDTTYISCLKLIDKYCLSSSFKQKIEDLYNCINEEIDCCFAEEE